MFGTGLLTGFVGAAGLVLTASSALALQPAPHRAEYAMALESARVTSGVIGAEGSLVYQWGDACDGWTVEQRYTLDMVYDQTKPVRIVSSFVTWESKDGRLYRFNERETRNGVVDTDIHGQAALTGADGSGTASFDRPKAQRFVLQPGTLFPTAHTFALLRAAEAGRHFLAAHVFDGSVVDGTSLISTVIGASLTGNAPIPDIDVRSPLLLPPSWRMWLAFFSDATKAMRPDYSLEMRLLDNGASSDMTLDYGDYVVKATLSKIEPMPKPAC